MDVTEKLARLRLQQSVLYIKFVHRAGIKNLEAIAVSHLLATGMDESPIGDDVPVFKIHEARSGGQKNDGDEKLWRSPPQ